MSSALQGDELDRLLKEVEDLPPEKIKELAAKAMEEKEKRKKYHSNTNLSPAQKADRREKQRQFNQAKRERTKLILKRASEMGIDLEKIKKEVDANG